MDDAKRRAIWDAYFEADFRQRYFLALKQRLAARLKWYSVAIAVLSCGPLVGLLWQVGASELLVSLGVVAGVLGIYIGASGIPRSLAVAVQAATSWGSSSTELSSLWVRCQSGEDVWPEFQKLDRDMKWIDAVATEHLDTGDQALIDAAWTKSSRALVQS